MIMKLVADRGVSLIPVDSEHSAIFQCLVGEKTSTVSRLTITASGGPFRGRTKDSLKLVTRREALNHPKWSMGDKITIDSATLMNKGLEIIEAHWLFGLPQDKIEVIVHPQSIIHSMVHFHDGSIKAQMSTTDMRHAILYALSYPTRPASSLAEWNLLEDSELTFEAVDHNTFPCVGLARQALESGGTAPCVLNAANEVAVRAFLDDEIGFLEIAELIEETMQQAQLLEKPDLSALLETDQITRTLTRQLIRQRAKA
jgi:1-deoxy-D-xylulose-5-phosphate reductoisomerase